MIRNLPHSKTERRLMLILSVFMPSCGFVVAAQNFITGQVSLTIIAMICLGIDIGGTVAIIAIELRARRHD